MILQIPDGFPPEYMNTIDLYLWIASLLVGLIGAFLFLKRRKASEIDIQRDLYFGLALFLFLFSLMRIAYILSVKLPFEDPGKDYDFYTSLGYVFGLAGLGGFLYGIERSIITKTKHLLTIFTYVVVVLGALSAFNVFDRSISMSATYAVVILDTLIMMILYLWLVKKTTGIIRKRTFIAFLGIVMLFASTMLDSQAAFSLAPGLNLLIAPIIATVGIAIIVYVQRF